MKTILILLLTIFTLTANAQTIVKNNYFIKNSGENVDKIIYKKPMFLVEDFNPPKQKKSRKIKPVGATLMAIGLGYCIVNPLFIKDDNLKGNTSLLIGAPVFIVGMCIKF